MYVIEVWKSGVATLQRDFQLNLDEGIKIAILMSMILNECQHMALQLGAAKHANFQEVRDKVMSVAGNRLQMSAPVPMDVGQAGHEAYAGGWICENEGKIEPQNVAAFVR